MLDQIFNSTNFNYLPRAMTAATVRQEVISHNIANVNTPNYRKTSVEFEDLLAKEIYGEDTEPEAKLVMTRTRNAHLPYKPVRRHAEPTMVEDNGTIMRADNNNVDIDIEMATLAKNQLYFNTIATQLGSYVSKVKNVITSGQS